MRGALQARAAEQLRAKLPELSIEGLPGDWELELSLVWRCDNSPFGAAIGRDRWVVCTIRLNKAVVLDGREATAVAYVGPVLETKTAFGSSERYWAQELRPALDRAIPRFVADWHTANPDQP